ncbi:sulfatase-like hydrolase/transferase [Tropicimonas sp. TH_r6]|uniref:sulfatase-like hydrolase/transferase n=1 Tax=Tropicimonas sp. TH_r6 TaxID=3082085 RepID=UPI002955BF93|nr:sulfatase-like hydrolase/transferase [Tropicimonas sp. TH_r6]MDV7141805.1 sulfatase-like hydrolase/transferase [Tropicimonas sp. TH_r6]
MPHARNMVLFVTDQWRWDTLNDPSHPAILPNLQGFREESTSFPNAFTTVPLCTPARGTLFTGKLPHQNGTIDNVQGTSFYPHGKLHPAQTTYLERLAADGYDVAFVGKWHLGDGTIHDRGIKDVSLSDGGDLPIMTTADVTFAEPRKSPYYGTITDGVPLDEQRVDAAIEKLEELASAGRPFCLVVCLHGPHFPHHVPKEYVDLYDDLPSDFMPDNWCPQFSEEGKPVAQSASYWPCQDTSHMTQDDWRRTAQHYWGFCSYIDALFGRLRRAISENDLDESTAIAFTADHGEMLGAHGWFDKGPFFYEEVMRIPMMIRAPGRDQGISKDAFVSFRDLFPTMMERTGGTALLDNEERQRSYWQSTADHACYVYDAYQGRQFRFRGIRDARYKYAWSPHDIEELYDLGNDPGERRNLAGDPRLGEVQADLKSRLFDWMNAEGDWLAGPGHHPPVGSYIDGRDRNEQHQHVPKKG